VAHDLVAARVAEQRRREAAGARTPLQLAWRQLTRYKLALVSGAVLVAAYVIMVFAEFFAPYALDFTDRSLFYAPPVGVHLVDARGRWHLRPFVYAYRLVDRDLRIYGPDTSRAYDIRFFVGSGTGCWGLPRPTSTWSAPILRPGSSSSAVTSSAEISSPGCCSAAGSRS